MPNICIACAAEVYAECNNPKYIDEEYFVPCAFVSDSEVEEIEEKRQRGRPVKEDSELQNAERVGRQRANRIKPISTGDKCEWAMLKYAGGGVEPVIGCMGNPAAVIHHGPDKSYLNNDESNLHKLCRDCHAIWHARNDKYYDSRPEDNSAFIPNQEYKEHDFISKATVDEVIANYKEVKKIAS